MNRFASLFLTVALLVSGVANAEGLDLFDRAASFALGVAAKSAEIGVGLDAEKRAIADPSQAESIRRNAGVVQEGFRQAEESLFDAARDKRTKPSKCRANNKGCKKKISSPLEPGELEIGTFGKMARNSITQRHHIPSSRWLELNRIDPNTAIAVRMSNARHYATQTHGKYNSFIAIDEKNHDFKDVMVRDLRDFRKIYLAAGVDDRIIKAKIKKIVELSVVRYGNAINLRQEIAK